MTETLNESDLDLERRLQAELAEEYPERCRSCAMVGCMVNNLAFRAASDVIDLEQARVWARQDGQDIERNCLGQAAAGDSCGYQSVK